ncbi:serine hydrolase domain-containing protein [Aliikangiella sp. IMCC44359]|uniref:serine hydrolase domain-containing protein n=1 Tax=Aliikangiella sp. IMCC44359 TaxID=3459125 RepID=UPI00403B07DC
MHPPNSLLKNNPFKPLKTTLLLVVIALITGSFIYQKELYRLYKVIFLFNENSITYNFQHMANIFPHNVIIKGKSNFNLTQSPQPLIKHFNYQDQTYSIQKLLDDTKTTGFIVIKNNQIFYEKYFLGNTIDTLNISWSVNKSYVSALIGIALNEGFIRSINDPITQYVPALINTGYDGVPIKHILHMSSGVDFNEDYADFFSDINKMGRVIALGHSINDFAASLKSIQPSGKKHRYVSMDTQVLGMLIKQATGQSPSAYLEQKIWRKLSMRSNAKWLKDDQGMELAFGTLNATLRDYAKFGLLYLNKGKWNGEQIIPQQWVIDSTSRQNINKQDPASHNSQPFLNYGYQWWIPQGEGRDFLAKGIYGQYIYVSPQYETVIVKTSADPKWKSADIKNKLTIKMFQSIARNL